jgi:hypothetical protein
MLTTDDTIIIARPIHDVFASARDVMNDPKWNSDTRTAVWATDGPIGEGTVFHIGFKPFLSASSCEMKVAGFAENQRLELTGNPGPMRARATFFFEAEGSAQGRPPDADSGDRAAVAAEAADGRPVAQAE